MPLIHFLNVGDGDCSVIEHVSGRVSVIDVCKAEALTETVVITEAVLAGLAKTTLGNFNQKAYPVNPISYLKSRGVDSVFRFIVTHPDMDHLDGIEAFFAAFSPLNFWDTDNNAEKEFKVEKRYREDDWEFYKALRDENPQTNPKRLTNYSGHKGDYWNTNGDKSGDGLHILAPTKTLVNDANECGDHNDCSYVLLYKTGRFRIVFGGDSHDKTWEHILEEHAADVKDVDLLIAPHHGRDSDRDYKFLDVLKPKLTFFGNARSQHLAYDAWNNRDLPFVTNNQAGSIIANIADGSMAVYVTNEHFARAKNKDTVFSDLLKGWYLQAVA